MWTAKERRRWLMAVSKKLEHDRVQQSRKKRRNAEEHCALEDI